MVSVRNSFILLTTLPKWISIMVVDKQRLTLVFLRLLFQRPNLLIAMQWLDVENTLGLVAI